MYHNLFQEIRLSDPEMPTDAQREVGLSFSRGMLSMCYSAKSHSYQIINRPVNTRLSTGTPAPSVHRSHQRRDWHSHCSISLHANCKQVWWKTMRIIQQRRFVRSWQFNFRVGQWTVDSILKETCEGFFFIFIQLSMRTTQCSWVAN